MSCTCAVADSFNVRARDLVNPTCPIHGTKTVAAQLNQSDARLILDTAEMLLNKGEIAAAQVLVDVITRSIGPEGVEILKRLGR